MQATYHYIIINTSNSPPPYAMVNGNQVIPLHPFVDERVNRMIHTITSLNFKDKRVILRADLNAPIKNTQFTQDYRLKAILPTINYIQKHGGKVILLTHLGRPKNNQFDANLSTRIAANWLEKQGYLVDYEIDLMQAIAKTYLNHSHILIVENLRFFEGEKKTNINFAQLLARLGDFYVNDAFGVLHRSDTSITLLAEQFYPHRRAYGLLVEKEMQELAHIKQHPKQPFFMILGGCKLEDKIGMIEQLARQEQDRRVSTIIAGGLVGQILLAAQSKMPISQEHPAALVLAQKALKLVQDFDIDLVLPEDFLVITQAIGTPAQICKPEQVPAHASCVDIGPETIKKFISHIPQARTIFANGTMGIYEETAYTQGTKAIFTALANTSAYRVIGGGDAVAATFHYGLAEHMNYLSTGGGATLAYLAAHDPENDLPGLRALKE